MGALSTDKTVDSVKEKRQQYQRYYDAIVRKRDPEARKLDYKRYHERHRDKLRIKRIKYYWENGGKEQRQEYIKLNKQRRRYWFWNSQMGLKMRVLSHYSDGLLECACCAENTFMFLTIDHNGIKKTKEQKTGIFFYRWLEKNNYPPGYKVLCYNCNCADGFFGCCPHVLGTNPEGIMG